MEVLWPSCMPGPSSSSSRQLESRGVRELQPHEYEHLENSKPAGARGFLSPLETGENCVYPPPPDQASPLAERTMHMVA